MADIVDPQVIAFCNNRVRPTADAIGKLYNTIVAIANEYTALGMATKIPNTADRIMDNATVPPGDGRPPVTGADITALINIASGIKTSLEASSNANRTAVLKVAVNTIP